MSEKYSEKLNLLIIKQKPISFAKVKNYFYENQDISKIYIANAVLKRIGSYFYRWNI